MIFVWQASWKPGLSREQMDGALMRRAAWSFPEGISVQGEYWLGSSEPVVLAILEADSYEPLFEMNLTWQDVFTIACAPACTPEDGLVWGPAALERRTA